VAQHAPLDFADYFLGFREFGKAIYWPIKGPPVQL
jgi:hypothetical protein